MSIRYVKEDDHITRRVASSFQPCSKSLLLLKYYSHLKPVHVNLKLNMEHNHGGLEDVVPQCFLCFFKKIRNSFTTPSSFHKEQKTGYMATSLGISLSTSTSFYPPAHHPFRFAKRRNRQLLLELIRGAIEDVKGMPWGSFAKVWR